MTDNPWVRHRTPQRIPQTNHSLLPETPDMSRDLDHTLRPIEQPATDSANATALGLPIQQHPAAAGLWVVGAHGGSGESTLAALDPTWQSAGHVWPLTAPHPARCVLVARSNLTGLLAAQVALRQWAQPAARPAVQLIGLVVVADAPGRLPKPLRDLALLVAGAAPAVWHMDWVEAWRTDPPTLVNCPRAVRDLVTALHHAPAVAVGAPSTPSTPPHAVERFLSVGNER